MIAARQGAHIRLPGLASAHSHAFQRALRGRTQRPAGGAASFWSWRDLMYRLAEQLTPDDIYHLSRFAFTELALGGVTAVGEFHYLHHDPAGQPYAERTTLADAVVRAALDAGLRIALLRTVYLRAGHGQALAPAQRRFVDARLEDALADVDALSARYAKEPRVTVAVAAHSVRAVAPEVLPEIAVFAAQRALPLHMHVAEQEREVAECQAETGDRPVALLNRLGILSPRFVAVHATHLDEQEILLLGRAKATVCLCRTTERDLGDGLPVTSTLRAAGVAVCVGADSHAAPDPFEELRAVEQDERSRLRRRHAAATPTELLEAGSSAGYRAIGFGTQAAGEDYTLLRADDPALVGAKDALLDDAVVYGATPRAVDRVVVAGRTIVEGGRHVSYDEALRAFRATLRRLELL